MISIALKILVKEYVFDIEKTRENEAENFPYYQKFSSRKYIHSQSFFLFYKYKITGCIETSWL